MALRKVQGGVIADNAITTTKIASGTIAVTDIADGSITSAKLAAGAVTPPTPTVVSDQANTSTGYFDLPSGTTAERPASPNVGMIRYNTTLGFLEQYTADGWQGIAPPPTISTISPTTYNGEQGTSFTITGSNFDSTVSVKFITAQGVEYTAAAMTRTNSSQLIATTPQDFSVANEPLKVKVINGSGLAYTLDNAIDCGGAPTWNTTAGSLGSVYDIMRDGYTVSVSAGDPDAGATVTYSLVTGSLPTGMSLNSSTGLISGTPNAVVSDTTYSFTLRATDNASNTTDRNFSITILAPIVVAFSYTGATQSWSKPSTLTKAVVKVWGAAGSGGVSYFTTYGGAGGYGYATVNLSAISSLNVVVGQGGPDYGNGEQSIYGHLLSSTDGRPGGFGAASGDGGGLSGIFNGAVTSQSNAVLIAGGGGGSGQVNNQRIHGAGGAGGGPNQNGDDGYDNPGGGGAHGRGGTTSAGGRSGLTYYVSPNGLASVSVATSGSALCGGHTHTSSNWTEGGGGGSGYYGGGAGAHEDTSGYWSAAGGGSGYANTSLCSNIVAYKGTYESQSSQATSDVDYASGVSIPGNGGAGGNGRVVIRY
jgi:hypothetical protein